MSLNTIAEKIAFFLVQKQIVEKEQIEIYSFGLEILIATCFNGVLVLLTAIALGVAAQTFFMLIPFMLIRSKAGGFHAKTHMGCITGFMVIYLASIFIIRVLPIETMQIVSIFELFICITIMIGIGSINHENRSVTELEYSNFKKASRTITIILFVLGLLGIYYFPQWFIYYVVGLCMAAGSLLVAWIIRKKKEDEKV